MSITVECLNIDVFGTAAGRRAGTPVNCSPSSTGRGGAGKEKDGWNMLSAPTWSDVSTRMLHHVDNVLVVRYRMQQRHLQGHRSE